MCGIAGIYKYSKKSPVDFNLIKSMCDLMIHRGPDAAGFFPSMEEFHKKGDRSEQIALGMRRLSVIDLETGFQPVFNENKRFVVIQNGEIYNYIELKEKLLKRGHRFYTKSDTEVIVHLFEDYGVESFNMFNGMFAISIWDTKSKTLYIARDRYGIKPLYYLDYSGELIFASEIPPILRASKFPRDIDWSAVDDYFSLYYISSPKTIFKYIRSLDPGNYLKINKDGVTVHKYWDFDYTKKLNLREEEYAEGIRHYLKEAVKKQLRSDVPVGIFLSSGLDSTSVLAYTSILADELELLSKPISSYTIGFNEYSYDERSGARNVAETYGTAHMDTVMPAHFVTESLEKIIFKLGQPFGAWNALPLLFVSKLARQNVKVVLTGTGGDEIFGGYPTLNAYYLNKIYSQFPYLMKELLKKIAEKLPSKYERTTWEFFLKSFLNGSDRDSIKAHFNWKKIFNEDEKNFLFSGNVKSRVENYDSFEIYSRYLNRIDKFDDLDKLLYYDQRIFNAGNTLPLTDITTMMESLEARIPFFDNDLVDFSIKIPIKMKVKAYKTKYILRKAILPILPKEIIKLKKMGFVIPENKWLAEDLKNFVLSMLPLLKKTDLFNYPYVEKLFNMHMEYKKDNSRKIQALISFQIWWNKFVGK